MHMRLLDNILYKRNMPNLLCRYTKHVRYSIAPEPGVRNKILKGLVVQLYTPYGCTYNWNTVITEDF